MRHLLRLIFLVVMMFPAAPALAQEIAVSELLAESPELSGQQITIQGELVGDYGFRGDGWMWTQLNDDAYVDHPIREGIAPEGGNIGVGVRIPSELAEDLDHPGGYHHRGPVVRLTGIWRHHDPDRQGESYLEVETLAVIQEGRVLDEGVVWWTVVAGIGLLATAGVLWRTQPIRDAR
ncbi:MAG TPA: hypothetical protein VFS66_03705 [Acidimicrobiia bacterium]|nr:hypothetical protein [Acidimicrobiia bacterium]